VKSDPLLRLLICDLVGKEVTREASRRCAMTSPTSPHRRKYLLMVIAHLRRLLELHLELVDEVEVELAPAKRLSQRAR
jgi:hypothetical protein